jgi:hypothetical protein
MVASCRGDLSFRRTARKATPVRLGDQAPGPWAGDVLDQLTSVLQGRGGEAEAPDDFAGDAKAEVILHSCFHNSGKSDLR